MYCPICENVLNKNTSGSKTTLLCVTCGNSEIKISEGDNLIYFTDEKKIETQKSGSSIYGYPSNQVTFNIPCPKCGAKKIRWEEDDEMIKTYGCVCTYSWKILKVG